MKRQRQIRGKKRVSRKKTAEALTIIYPTSPQRPASEPLGSAADREVCDVEMALAGKFLLQLCPGTARAAR